MSDTQGQPMTVRDVADYLNVAEKVVYRLAKHGGFPGLRVAEVWRFMRADLDAWVDEQKRLAAEQSTGGSKA